MRRGTTPSALIFIAAAGILIALGALAAGLSAPLEAFGFVAGIIAVYLAARENAWNWPIGLFNTGSYVLVFAQSRLYADSALNAIYFGLGLFGWYWWFRGKGTEKQVRVARAPMWPLVGLVLGGIPVTWLVMQVLIKVQGAAPFWDAVLMVYSLIAQYLLTRKYIENWVIWIVVDVAYVPLYVSRGLHLTAVLYGVFIVLAVLGFLEWNRQVSEIGMLKE